MTGSRTSPPGIPTPTDAAVASAITAWVAAGSNAHPAGVVAAVVARVARRRELDVDLVIDGRTVPPDPAALAVEVDAGILDLGAWLPGFVREALVSGVDRSSGGVHHTAPDVARAVVDAATEIRPFRRGDTVLDPAVGGGAFLLAAVERMAGPPAERVAHLRGCDTDPLAVATAVASLRLWGDGVAVAPNAFRVADGLDARWDVPVDVVVGNPPFLSQLRGRAVRGDDRRAVLRERWPTVGGYVDDALLFLLSAAETIVDDGVVAMIQPASCLASRDGESVRELVASAAPPVAVWLDGERRFAAAVDTVALVLHPGASAGPVARSAGVPRRALGSVTLRGAASWAPLLARGVPELGDADIAVSGRLGDVASSTAGFRDQYYGLRGAVVDDPTGAVRLMTSGLIDPLVDRWGEIPCRFNRRRWQHPTVDVDAVDPGIQAWVASRLRPKLLVASQTKVIETVIDDDGTMLPCTPVIAVEPRDGAPSLAHLAVVLTSPVATRLLLDHAAGTALSRDAMRITAAGLAELPLPADRAAWDDAAGMVEALGRRDRGVDIDGVAAACVTAYGVDDGAELHNWWRSRRPAR
ncbi:MAG: N-6 DNA methylase [Actinomycetota bacterium]